MHGCAVITEAGKFALKPVHVVNGIVDPDANGNRCDCDGHDIQRNVCPTHDAEDKCGSNGIGDNADHRDGERAKKGEKHQHDGQHHHSERQNL